MNIHLKKLKEELSSLSERISDAVNMMDGQAYRELSQRKASLEQRIETLEGVGVPPEGKRDIWTSGI